MNDKITVKLWLVIVILVAIIAFGVGFFVGGKKDNKEPEKNEVPKTTEQSKDDKLLKELSDKVDKLSFMGFPSGELLYEKNRDLADFEEVALVSVALHETKKQEMGGYYCYNNKKNILEDESECGDSSYSEINSYINYEDIAKLYKELFNKELEKKDILNYCPMVLYDKKIDGFYLAYPCGGTGYNTEYHYTYDAELDGDKAYAYVAYGVNECCSEEPDIYTDFARKNKYTGKVTGEFKITEDNYKDFSKYKITFEKADDNYYFSRIELIQ